MSLPAEVQVVEDTARSRAAEAVQDAIEEAIDGVWVDMQAFIDRLRITGQLQKMTASELADELLHGLAPEGF